MRVLIFEASGRDANMAWPSERKAYRGELGGDREPVSLSPIER